MKVVVTGAGGYLGTGIVKALCDDGIDVLAVCHTNTKGIDNRAKPIECDIFEIDDPYDFFGNPDILLHLAWRNGFVHNDYSHIIDLPYHFSFVEKMIEGGCRQIAIMGTMHEVGFFEGSINENTPTRPESLYGISKDAFRNAIGLLCRNADCVFQWLRGYYIVGNTEYGNSIFSKITAAEKNHQMLFPFTNGTNQWDFIDYDEFCRQVATTIEQTEITGIINICSGYPQKLSDRVERFISENNYSIKLDYGKYPNRPYDSKAVWGDDEKICRIMKKRNNTD